MKKLILIFLLISGFVFSQNKELYKTLTNNDIIILFNKNLKLKDQSLDQNIERCRFIISDADKKNDDNTALAFNLFLDALISAKEDKDNVFISIYKDEISYNFYDSANKFVGRIYLPELEQSIASNGDNTETYFKNYFYIKQQ